MWKYKPKIVAITGTVGKTSAKDAIDIVLARHYFVRKSEKSYNGEIGIPLTIIGVTSAWTSIVRWFFILFKGFRLLLVRHDYPKVLVLETGVDRPGGMKNLLKWLTPTISVVTSFGETPAHVEFFKNQEELIREKTELIKVLGKKDYAILNGDDQKVFNIKDKTKANIITYGFNDTNDLVASNYHIIYQEGRESGIPLGINFKIDYRGSMIPIRLSGLLGRQAVYSILAALAVGAAEDLNILEVAESLTKYKLPPGRMNLIAGIKESIIIDDSYNSSPTAIEAALEALGEVKSTGRKIAVLGDMLELGRHATEAHQEAGRVAAENVDLLFTVGPRAKFIAAGAIKNGLSNNKIFISNDLQEAECLLLKTIKAGDIILVKGSQSVRMERVVAEIMARPEDKKKLLARQEQEWLDR